MKRLMVLVLSGWFAPFAFADVVLENAHWRIQLQPQTLAIEATPRGEPAVRVSAGVARHAVSGLQQASGQAHWQWDDGAWAVHAHLVERELRLTLSARTPGRLAVLNQPGTASGKGLIWPLAEGHYVPATDARWLDFFEREGDLNTTEDLSLPLWGIDHDRFTLHWLLTEPFNNRLRISRDQGRPAIALSHEFSALAAATPMTLRLVLGGADPLVGARRYREWLQESGRYDDLSDALTTHPDTHKLIGASHVYLWGNTLLGEQDVTDWPRLIATLNGTSPLAQSLREALPAATRTLLKQAPAPLAPYQRTALLRDLNGALNSLARAPWQKAVEPDMTALAQGYAVLRRQVSEVFAGALAADPDTWGDTLSLGSIERLVASGLPRLWLGLGDGWEGGLWHPQVIEAGVAAGYLLAPYDSYATALPTAANPDWTTAHLGRDAYRRCAVINVDGQPRKGFLGAGHYTDPHCVMPSMQARVSAIQRHAGFNSWFLDVAGAGMVFDSYRAEAPMSQAHNAAGNTGLLAWLSLQAGLVTGSENGNAVTARGAVFAHGMQTPVIGWGDRALHSDPASPWFLGRWYPPEQPSVFFKHVPLKEPYRTVHFAPQTRLPLYQAVFHGSVITSHHWLFDNLKLSNVRTENELTQLLYNVAPLYHLSRATWARRLPIIQRQDAFFRPLHQRLATQALVGFEVLSPDRLVQQTRFADGTRLIANFAQQPRTVEHITLAANSVVALLPDGTQTLYQAGVD